MKPVVFLDRDGVITIDRGYTYRVEDYALVPGVVDGLRALKKTGFSLVVITNQSGIARGLFSEEAYRAFTEHMVSDLENKGVYLDGVLHCPHHPTEGIGKYRVDCDCRKPKPGMIYAAEQQFGPFDYANAWVIGDKITDIEAGKNAHVSIRGMLISKNGEDDGGRYSLVQGVDFTAANFLEAARIILEEHKEV